MVDIVGVAERRLSIRERLRAKRFFVTGGTGFLGTALIERLLRSIPDAEVVALVRPGRRASAHERALREIVRNDCFDPLRRLLGDSFEETIASRLTTVAGDVSEDALGLNEAGLQTLRSCDVVVHSAATVSFDAPLDQAVEVNLLGPSRVADAIQRAWTTDGPGSRRPHLIAVSTAYVAGTHQGEANEQLLTENPLVPPVDWQGEVDFARKLRAELELESRQPQRLRELIERARAEQGAAGSHLLATRAERLREDWVSQSLVEAGLTRAKALGWPDTYAYTKALGEIALVAQFGHSAPSAGASAHGRNRLHGGRSANAANTTEGDAGNQIPITIVRPSIIESALAEPFPGWIRGFRMAEPIIISYARGLLREFPGVPEGVIDVIPVDLVVSAILAIAAAGATSPPAVYHVASSVRRPLRYGQMHELVYDWFSRHPLYDDRGQPISVPKWSLPGRGRVQQQLQRATQLMRAGERLLAAFPGRAKRVANWAATLEDRQGLAQRALSYVELYGAYTETEARYRVDRLLELWQRMSSEEQERFCFDPAAIDWERYVSEIHLPSVVARARVKTTPGRPAGISRAERARRAILSPDRHLAVFDLEHTLLSSNVVDSYSWLASRHLPFDRRIRFVGQLLAGAPRWLALDRRDRGDFLRSFYRRYEGAPVATVEADAWELFHRFLITRMFPEGLARVRRHRSLGHRTLLITGALDVIVAPLVPLFDDVVSARLGRHNGYFTGQLEELPPTGEARAAMLQRYARDHGLSLAESVAYGDSTSDLAMLEAVGYPVAVNPDSRLAALARRRGWHVEYWSKAPGGADRPLPLGPFDPRPVRSEVRQ